MVVMVGLAAVVWWGLPRLYGGAHTKTAQMDRHGQGGESGEWMWSRAFRPLHYVLSCRALFVSCDDGDEVEHEPVFLLLVGGGAGWDRQTARYDMLTMMYDTTLGD